MARKLQITLAGPAFILVMGLAMVLARRQPGPPALHHWVQIVDQLNRTVAVPEQPQSILSLCTSATDTIVRLGQGRRLAAIDEYSRIVPGCGHAAVIGKGGAISREQVLALRIDLAFIWWFQNDADQLLTDLGIPVVRIQAGRASSVPATIRLIGKCLAATAAANALADRVERFLNDLPHGPTRRRPMIYLELYGPFKTVGGRTYINDVIELAGGQNIAARLSGSVLFSTETLIQADPDAIFYEREYQSAEAIACRPGLSGLKAIRSGRLFAVQSYDLVAGAGLPETVLKLQKKIADLIH